MSRLRDNGEERIRIPLSQKVVRNAEFDGELRDDAFAPDRTTLVAGAARALREDDRLISMGEMIMEKDGGSLRTFAGNLAHENGWWPSRKRGRNQHWEGETALNALMLQECEHDVLWAQSEPCLLSFVIGNRRYEWYADLLVRMAEAPDELWELKKDERQLEDEDYCLKLAGVREICRRIGMRFRVVMADEVFAHRHHRDNVWLFASRRFVTITPEQMRRFEAFAIGNGPESTYGELADAIDPSCRNRGKAVLQGLTIQRRVEIDLRSFLTNRTPVRIH